MNTAAKVAEHTMGPSPSLATPTQPKLHPTEKMKACVYQGVKNVKLVEVPKPMITAPKDALIKVTTTTVCGSDLHLYHNEIKDMEKGDILGHEFMGIVEDVGSDVTSIKKGDRVIVSFNISCGTCDYCKREEYTACDTTNPSQVMEKAYGHRCAGMFGYSHLTGGYPGGQAEYVRVPFADTNCYPVPPGIPDDKVLFLTDIAATAWHANELASVKKGDTVAIWGAGPVGLLAAKWAEIRGASKIVLIDSLPYRLSIAEEHIANLQTINFTKEKTLDKLKEILPNGPDCSLDCCGFRYAKSWIHSFERAVSLETDSGDVISECIYATRKFGTIGVVGDYVGYVNHFPIGALMEKGLTMRLGQTPTQKYFKTLMGYIESGEFDPRFIITHRMSLEDIVEGYRIFDEKEDQAVKILFTPGLKSREE